MTGTSLSVSGTVTGASLAGTITTASQTNITAVGTLSSLSVTANVQGGNIRTAGLISATGGVTAASVAGGVITGTSTSVTGSQTAASTVGGVITGTSTIQAQAYGGDINMPGVRGCFWVSCLDNSCWNKHYVPYPAGLVNTCGGTASIGSRGSTYQNFEQCIAGSAIGYAYMTSQYVPGLGGTTSHVTGGTCTCGVPGRPGLIRVTYS
jgi:hypothetical protein